MQCLPFTLRCLWLFLLEMQYVHIFQLFGVSQSIYDLVYKNKERYFLKICDLGKFVFSIPFVISTNKSFIDFVVYPLDAQTQHQQAS
jgi:hypothetical protein